MLLEIQPRGINPAMIKSARIGNPLMDLFGMAPGETFTMSGPRGPI